MAGQRSAREVKPCITTCTMGGVPDMRDDLDSASTQRDCDGASS